MEPARRVAFAGRVEPADRFVVVGGGEPSVTEVSTDGHACPLIVAAGMGIDVDGRTGTRGLLRLEQREGVAVGILEPRGPADAGGRRDVADGLEVREVVVLEHHPPGEEVLDVTLHIRRLEG